MVVRQLNKEISGIISDVAELGNYLWQKGWAERNAGNISVNITEYVTESLKKERSEQDGVCLELDKSYQVIAGYYFLVTGTGKRMRDLASDPGRNALIVHLNEKGNAYNMLSISEVENSIYPTSELPAHLAVQEQLVKKGARERSVIHTHPNELISITQIKQYCDENALNHLLWGMHPETIMMVPEGAGFLPYLLTGSLEIADATVKKFETHKVVIWEKHGCFAIGKDVFEAFDLVDTLVKSAQIYFQCRSAGYDPEGLTEEMMAGLKELSRKFLA